MMQGPSSSTVALVEAQALVSSAELREGGISRPPTVTSVPEDKTPIAGTEASSDVVIGFFLFRRRTIGSLSTGVLGR